MNPKSLLTILGVFLGISIILNLYSVIKVRDLEQQLALKNVASNKLHESHEEFELAEKMMFLQRYTEKLYFAGKQKNWELAAFYLEEIEETVEKIMHANKIEDGINISVQMKEMLYPKVKELEQKIEKGEFSEFEKGYQMLVMNCNGCHMATNHGFVKIRIPQQNYYSQEF